jgi:hypothetical protein
MTEDEQSNQNERDFQRIQASCVGLGEHFDTVHILATKLTDDGRDTVKFSWGKGNWYARYGQIREWVLLEEQAAKNSIKDE